MPKPIQLPEPCENCGENKWWDNRESKKSPKHPDYKCANKECKGKDGYPTGRWAKEEKKPQGGRLTPDDTTPQERAEGLGLSWANLTYTYGKLFTAVGAVMQREGFPMTSADVQAGVATLLIQGEKMHIPLLKAPAKKPEKVTMEKVLPKPVPKHLAEDFENVPPALDEDESDSLPF